jgi:hypothetical protein
MRYTPFIDLFIFLINIYFAIVNRGTLWGAISTLIVIFYVWLLIKTIREV